MTVAAIAETIVQDLRYAVRGLVKNKGFAVAAVMTLALGIGATTAVFSVVDLILFRDLPYAEAGRLVSVGIEVPGSGVSLGQEFLFAGAYLQWRKRQTAFESFTAWSGTSDPFGGDANPSCDLTESRSSRITCAFAAASFLPTLGVHPLIGRGFTPEEDVAGVPIVALLSYSMWQTHYAANPSIINKIISLNGRPVQIIGVLPKTFEMPTLEDFDLLVPNRFPEDRWTQVDSGRQVWAFGRLRPRETMAQAESELQPLFHEFLQPLPAKFQKDVHLRIRSLRDRQVGDVKGASWVLLGAVLSVLLIACANVANLLLARGAARRKEVSVRIAVGASRLRLFGQALTEAVLIGILGGIAGSAFAEALLKWIQSTAPEGITRLERARLDPRVLAFTLLVSLGSALGFGLASVMQTPSAETLASWRTVGSRSILRNIIVTSQIAISIVLLTGASLLVRSLWSLEEVPLGIPTEGLTTFTVALGQQKYPDLNAQNTFFDRLEQNLASTAGVVSYSISDTVPLGAASRSNPFSFVQYEGQKEIPEGFGGKVVWRIVTPSYFSTLQVPIVRGRGFEPQDRLSSTDVILLNQTLARRLFGAADPLHRFIRFGGKGAPFEIIGVTADVRNAPVTENNLPEYYRLRKPATAGEPPQQFSFGRSATISVRSSMSVSALTEQVRAAVASLDAALPVDVETMTLRAEKLTRRSRFNALVLSLFSSIGLALAAIGLYGVIAFVVTQRTQEIGVRIALGSTRSGIVKLILVYAGRWTGLGMAAGIAGSFAATRWLRALLYGVQEHDRWSAGFAIALLAVIALMAAAIPSWRASRTDPLIALRHD